MVRNGGRDQSVRLVAINRWRWSQSLGARTLRPLLKRMPPAEAARYRAMLAED